MEMGKVGAQPGTLGDGALARAGAGRPHARASLAAELLDEVAGVGQLGRRLRLRALERLDLLQRGGGGRGRLVNQAARLAGLPQQLAGRLLGLPAGFKDARSEGR